eukprot:750292-Hanusia_phi.AAC.5
MSEGVKCDPYAVCGDPKQTVLLRLLHDLAGLSETDIPPGTGTTLRGERRAEYLYLALQFRTFLEMTSVAKDICVIPHKNCKFGMLDLLQIALPTALMDQIRPRLVLVISDARRTDRFDLPLLCFSVMLPCRCLLATTRRELREKQMGWWGTGVRISCRTTRQQGRLFASSCCMCRGETSRGGYHRSKQQAEER